MEEFQMTTVADWEKIREICQSLYDTGVNDGKNGTNYYPKPTEFRAKQIMDIISLQRQEMIESVSKLKRENKLAYEDRIDTPDEWFKIYDQALDDVIKLLTK